MNKWDYDENIKINNFQGHQTNVPHFSATNNIDNESSNTFQPHINLQCSNKSNPEQFSVHAHVSPKKIYNDRVKISIQVQNDSYKAIEFPNSSHDTIKYESSSKRIKYSPPFNQKIKSSTNQTEHTHIRLKPKSAYSAYANTKRGKDDCHSSQTKEDQKLWDDIDLCEIKSDMSNVSSTPPWNPPDSESDSGRDSEEDNVDLPFKITKGANLYPISKIPFIDTHCHLDYMFVRESHVTSLKSYISRKDFPSNFSGCITCFCDPPSIKDNDYYEDVLSENGVWGTFGLHPHNATWYDDKILQQLIKANSHEKSVAWGEMGLDYNNPQTSDNVKHAQQRAFVGQLQAAVTLQKPIVIHGRSANEDTLLLLKQYVPRDYKIHYHCFSGSLEFANQLTEYFPNLFIGITGLITYKNPDLIRVVKEIPFHRILIETDAPFIRPFYHHYLDKDVNRAGSTPGMGLIIAQKLSEIKELDLDDVLIQIRENVNEMYSI